MWLGVNYVMPHIVAAWSKLRAAKIVVAWNKLWRNISAESLIEKANGQKLKNISPKILIGLTQAQAHTTPRPAWPRSGRQAGSAHARVVVTLHHSNRKTMPELFSKTK